MISLITTGIAGAGDKHRILRRMHDRLHGSAASTSVAPSRFPPVCHVFLPTHLSGQGPPPTP